MLEPQWAYALSVISDCLRTWEVAINWSVPSKPPSSLQPCHRCILPWKLTVPRLDRNVFLPLGPHRLLHKWPLICLPQDAYFVNGTIPISKERAVQIGSYTYMHVTHKGYIHFQRNECGNKIRYTSPIWTNAKQGKVSLWITGFVLLKIYNEVLFWRTVTPARLGNSDVTYQ